MERLIQKYCLYLVLLFFAIIYSLFPTINHSTDAWGFAAYIKQGENLFLSHHLLYNSIGYIWVKGVGLFFDIDPLRLLVVMNTLFTVATLILLGKTLRLIGIEEKRIAVWIAFAGSSWAVSRYATENETYIIPMFFSLTGSFFFLKNIQNNKNINLLLSGLFGSVSCLFHQVMFFWWFSLLIGVIIRRDIKKILQFASPALLVPLVYTAIITLFQNEPFSLFTLLRFIFRDYYSGAAGISIGSGSTLLTVISFIRSFIQVHGYLINLAEFNLLLVIMGAVGFLTIIAGFMRVGLIQWVWGNANKQSVWIHILAFFLQLTFALLSNGNAEFMVMIPVLLVIIFSQIIQNEIRVIAILSAGILLWNLSVGLIPLNKYRLDNSSEIAEIIIRRNTEGCGVLFILFNKPGVENEVKYYTGSYPGRIISGIKKDSADHIRIRIDDALMKGDTIITDCISRPKTLSRERYILSSDYSNLFNGYKLIPVDSSNCLMGRYYLYRVVR